MFPSPLRACQAAGDAQLSAYTMGRQNNAEQKKHPTRPWAHILLGPHPRLPELGRGWGGMRGGSSCGPGEGEEWERDQPPPLGCTLNQLGESD